MNTRHIQAALVIVVAAGAATAGYRWSSTVAEEQVEGSGTIPSVSSDASLNRTAGSFPELEATPVFEDVDLLADELIFPPEVTYFAKNTTPTRIPEEKDLTTLGEDVSREANHLLALLADRYGLSETQQALAFPVIARASRSYDPALPIEGEAMTDAYLASIGEDIYPAAESYDDLESLVAPFLDESQQARVEEEQVDRFYWWAEVLENVASGPDIDETLAAALWLGNAEPEPELEPDPPTYGGGNLF